ncbi:MAG: hypothetical protein R3C53_21715 [Pirellulaceae bacterium]
MMLSRAFLFCAILILGASPLQAQTTFRIEEDWELHVTHPDQQLDAPQITTMMLPFGNLSEMLVQFDFNHGHTPDFSAGGIQVRVTENDESLDSYRMQEGQKLSEENELVSWTQVIQKASNGYYFGIINGQSESFGSFGSVSEAAFVTNGDAGIVSLNAYRFEDSLENSGVSYAANRVTYLRLKRVRLYNSSGEGIEIVVNQDTQQ